MVWARTVSDVVERTLQVAARVGVDRCVRADRQLWKIIRGCLSCFRVASEEKRMLLFPSPFQ